MNIYIYYISDTKLLIKKFYKYYLYAWFCTYCIVAMLIKSDRGQIKVTMLVSDNR